MFQSLNVGEEFSSECSSGEDSKNVAFRAEDEELDQARNNNESVCSSDTHPIHAESATDSTAIVSAKGTEAGQSEQSPIKKRKVTRKKVTTVEKVVTDMILSFAKLQKESEERFLKYKERRGNEERAHEERLLQLILGAQSPRQGPAYFCPPTFPDSIQSCILTAPTFSVILQSYHN